MLHVPHDRFMMFVERTLAQHPTEAALGGVPSIHNKIRAFLDIQFRKLGVLIKPNLEVCTPILCHYSPGLSVNTVSNVSLSKSVCK